VAYFCEHGSGPPGSVYCRVFLDKLNVIDITERTVPYEIQWLPSCPFLVHFAPRRLKCLYC